MSKFCPNCGNLLNESMQCNSCNYVVQNQQDTQKFASNDNVDTMVPNTQNPRNTSSQAFSNFLSIILTLTKDFISSPVSIIKNVIRQEFLFIGLFYIFLSSFIIALFPTILSAKATSGFGDLGPSINLFEIFFKAFFISIIIQFLLSAIIWGCLKLFNQEVSFKSLIDLVGVSSIPSIISYFLAIILSIVGLYQIALFLIIISTLTSILLVYSAISSVSKVTEDKLFYQICLIYSIQIIISSVLIGNVLNSFTILSLLR